jgi:hypothetical protein
LLASSKTLITSTHIMTLLIASISIILVILVILGNTSPKAKVYAHVSGPTLQQWVDKETGIKIQFATKPEKPIADSLTDLSISVQNLTTGQHIMNFKSSVIIINDFQRAFKILNIPVVNGDFSLKYSFPDSGHNQVLVSIKKDSFGLALASFRVSVLAPFPPPEILAKSIIVGGVMPGATLIAILILIKKSTGSRIGA